jgi:hypothetical protein
MDNDHIEVTDEKIQDLILWVVIIHLNTFLYGKCFFPIVNANGVVSLVGSTIVTSNTSIAIAITFFPPPSFALAIHAVPFVPKAK